MKFLLLLPSTNRGGVEEYALKITSAAVSRGWEVHAAFPEVPETASLIQDFRANGICYHQLLIDEQTCHGTAYILSLIPRFWRTLVLLLTLKPTAVQIVLPWFNRCLGSILACGVLRVPTAVRFGLVPPQFSLGAWRLKLFAWARARNQKWIAVSEHNRELICNAFQIPLPEMSRIYNGTNIRLAESDASALTATRHNVRHELGLSQDQKIALTVARLESQKGYSDLISTIPHLIDEFPDLQFVWIGDGQERTALIDQLKDYGIQDRVKLLGYRSDVPELMQAADLFIFPTRYEGHPSALLEAMAQGVPIVASNASSIPEMITHRVEGLLFRVGDSCDLLETLRWALRHPTQMQEMARSAQQKIQQFSKERMIEETLNFLEKLSDSSSRQSGCGSQLVD